jgi:hypothetical protein
MPFAIAPFSARATVPGTWLGQGTGSSVTIASFTITQVDPNHQAPFSGLTFSTVPIAAVPEPETYALIPVGSRCLAPLKCVPALMPLSVDKN